MCWVVGVVGSRIGVVEEVAVTWWVEAVVKLAEWGLASGVMLLPPGAQSPRAWVTPPCTHCSP